VSVRLRRLDLLRYGHFTDKSFDLAGGETGVSVIFGPNEAGKSTALSAIDDLLFGIPTHSSFGFLHDYASMRIGAVLEDGDEALEVVRRKGNKDTLLNCDGLPMSGGESALRPYLAGADRAFFVRMFSLDHSRLEAGGREILEAKDDVGQMLFAAGAGIVGLRDKLSDLSNEADTLWTDRRAKGRSFYEASDRLKAAETTLRDQTLTAAKWLELKRAYEATEEAYEEVNKSSMQASAELSRVGRIRRVFREARRKQELDRLLDDMGDVVELPEDAASVAQGAERKDAETGTKVATLQGQLDKGSEGQKKLVYDEALLQRADDIHQLHERRIEIRREKADLPKRQAELHAAEEELRGFASELGWSGVHVAGLIERIPPRTKVSVVRSLFNQKGELEVEAAGQTRALTESRDAWERLQCLLEDTGEPADVSRLAIAVKTIRETGDISGRGRAAENAARDTRGRVDRRLAAMSPAAGREADLIQMVVPARADVQAHRDRVQDWNQRARAEQLKGDSFQQQYDEAVAALERRVREEDVVTAESLGEARNRRDSLWQLVKLKHLRGEEVAEEQRRIFADELNDLAAAFELAMVRADDLADRRFEHAEVAGQLAQSKRQIDALEDQLLRARKTEAKLAVEHEQLTASWLEMWRGAPFDPLTPEVMLEWLDSRDEVFAALEEREAANSALVGARAEEDKAREQLLEELVNVGVGRTALEQDALPSVLERAAEEQRDGEKEASRKAQLEKDMEIASTDVRRRESDCVQAKAALDQWQAKWQAGLIAMGLDADAVPEAASVQVDIIDQMRDAAARINSLKNDRIDKINRDAADFEKVVQELLEDLAKDLLGKPADDTVVAIEKRLEDSQRLRDLHEKQVDAIEELSRQIEALDAERRESASSIAHLNQAAGTQDLGALKAAIERSDEQRTLVEERAQIVTKLQQDGDGLSIDALAKECEDVDIDEISALEKSIQVEMVDLQARHGEAAELRSRARDDFQAIGGDDAAAQAAADKQEALAEMGEVAERFVRVKTSAILLKWAIDRYRREKQAPLLKRAGELFQIFTGGSFGTLQVSFDDHDKAQLTGMRPDGSIVPVSGMSTGSADQLYLALRVASIEDYLDRAGALPFVADDLFINFDDVRAAAGFRLLGELSRKTQVLFFTHHQHLVDIARETLGDSVGLISLTERNETRT
jgi:uncharacterized protein YhaN